MLSGLYLSSKNSFRMHFMYLRINYQIIHSIAQVGIAAGDVDLTELPRRDVVKHF